MAKHIEKTDFTQAEQEYFDQLFKRLFKATASYLPATYIYMGIALFFVLGFLSIVAYAIEFVILQWLFIVLCLLSIPWGIIADSIALQNRQNKVFNIIGDRKDIGEFKGKRFCVYKIWQYYLGLYYDSFIYYEHSSSVDLTETPPEISRKYNLEEELKCSNMKPKPDRL